ncbi:hypothetical protein CLAFUW4_08605 [Fulvia fulva]|uniref:DUF6604 domain-containing protein n=1 Tax=Passalora fulva TaxID=5499 RepID=A0A9Q8LDN9_PASFU|nr:uncharacterized protein CLAFUR5_08707 [Fulvia fulva]KAK4629901.1 hypothetical protein CLAFUR0_08603 [Fulvia fulva]UJO15484.1 hypothetical protein CLAFUR5_08707 [Fulvia fulva]WPV13042.1 hypothetical protein CLAFUW4_08605 [Fulvia fulva]
MSFNLVDRYALYKEGTNRVTRWLVGTATACRRSATAKNKSGIISTRELLQYANLIAGWKPPIEIPGNIVELIKDVVVGRKACAEFYDAQNAADAGHDAFICAPEDIGEKLRGARRSRKKEKGPAREDVSDAHQELGSKGLKAEALRNLFEHLQVEDSSEEAWRSVPVKNEVKHLIAPPKASPTLETDPEEETRFALFCSSRACSRFERSLRRPGQRLAITSSATQQLP